jgi:hypothetical protein
MLLSAAGEMLAAILSHASDESGLKDWGTSDLGPNKNTMSERRGPNLEAEL